ncbi:hypothetical protein [Caedibacter taeniospiralis]|uniref:hypothetical protein n=1 Tax=Caedibacter taeniospiralis TaxID=28907 RepID=UPI000C280B28|nr:hypothetical protein [Caedibacter taeniospiralis]
MSSERQKLKTDIQNIKRIIELIMQKEKVLIDYSGEEKFKKVISYFNEAIVCFEKKKDSLPIGYRYTGIFYTKKPYTYPVESVKNKETLFMPEHLSSWEKKLTKDGYEYSYYLRAV